MQPKLHDHQGEDREPSEVLETKAPHRRGQQEADSSWPRLRFGSICACKFFREDQSKPIPRLHPCTICCEVQE